ncbi:hypothetical protein [Treponema denticola]|uniref:hypothetical protein n=1 Tax=Treponema denticola TaxID=158 RepID=UPI0001FD3CFC|nr:hypothetical protein [Treponema denticola]EGC76894.1 hypothetical protein HMPREF9353_01996 [Treponema denticola F0402]
MSDNPETVLDQKNDEAVVVENNVVENDNEASLEEKKTPETKEVKITKKSTVFSLKSE